MALFMMRRLAREKCRINYRRMADRTASGAATPTREHWIPQHLWYPNSMTPLRSVGELPPHTTVGPPDHVIREKKSRTLWLSHNFSGHSQPLCGASKRHLETGTYKGHGQNDGARQALWWRVLHKVVVGMGARPQLDRVWRTSLTMRRVS